jgi:oligopeptide/dipeptide ABC transporter ATP-binding protein
VPCSTHGCAAWWHRRRLSDPSAEPVLRHFDEASDGGSGSGTVPPTGALVDVRKLKVSVASDGRLVPAVREISFSISAAERVGLVGESGAGKSLTGLALMRLVHSPNRQSGEILIQGRDVMKLSAKELARLRGNLVAMVYQNPLSSLNPVRTVGHQIDEAIAVHHPDIDGRDRRDRVESLLAEVGLRMPRAYYRFPHELSGGQRQRVVIAMAVACRPALLIADEPTSALDVTTQQVIMELLVRLAEDHRMSMVFITHDLALAAQYCDEVIVMYAGEIVEKAASADLLTSPKHPYARALVESVCTLDQDPRRPLAAIPGQMPGVDAVPSGCPFHPRCTFARDICRVDEPPAVPTGPAGRFARCHFVHEIESAAATNDRT